MEAHKYITNGAFCRVVAIEEGYQYIIDHQSNHIYLNIIVTGKHKCEEACLSDGYCNPIDQEDYTHAIRTIIIFSICSKQQETMEKVDSIPCYMIANTMNGGILGTGSYFMITSKRSMSSQA